MAFYRFKVTYWDAFDEAERQDCGVVFAEGYAGAAGKLESWCDNDLISIDLLYETDNDTVLLDSVMMDFVKAKEA